MKNKDQGNGNIDISSSSYCHKRLAFRDYIAWLMVWFKIASLVSYAMDTVIYLT